MQFRAIFSFLGSHLWHGSRPVQTPRVGHGRGTALKAGALALAGIGATAAAPAAANDVVITVTDVRSSKGVVRACITTNPKAFPKCKKDPKARSVVVPAGKTVTIRFKGVKPGKYAIALLHDENNNGKADRTLGMIPKEGYGFSRDAKVRMGPPKFKDAVFTHGSSSQKLKIKMRYW